MESMQLVVKKTFWDLEVVKDDGAARRRSASLPPPQRKDLDDQDCFDEVRLNRNKPERRLPLEDLSGWQAVQADSSCPEAVEACEVSSAEGTDVEDYLESRKTDFQEKLHTLQTHKSASCSVTTANFAMQPSKQSPLAVGLSKPASMDSSVCTSQTAWAPSQPLDTRTNLFQSKALETSTSPVTGSAWRARDLDELLALKQKLGQALATMQNGSLKPDHTLTSARKVHMVQSTPNVELSALKDKLRQALSSASSRATIAA